MNQQNQEHFIGLDIGTSSVRCVVGMFDPNGSSTPSIIGHGSAPTRGCAAVRWFMSMKWPTPSCTP
jgi:cell division ATPase FtsA